MDSIGNRKYATNPDLMNPHIFHIEYAVRGPMLTRALQIQKEMQSGAGCPKAFNEIIWCNIGDCHAMGQQPITFLRQVMALLADPSLLDTDLYPADAKQRARRILNECGGLQFYSSVLGLSVVRADCAKYIEVRDGVTCNPNDVILLTGAGEGIKEILQTFSRLQSDSQSFGVMIPIPQYPLYSASITQFNLRTVPYYLDESDDWSLSIDELRRAYDEGLIQCKPRILVVINPGNPTGQVLRRDAIEHVIQFAKEKKLFILADEFYQSNVYAEGVKFYSFKQVLHSMGEAYFKQVELASLMSASKGYAGECGFRGGYCELLNAESSMTSLLHKQLSNRICPSVIGQAILDVIVNPPQLDEASFEQHELEKQKVLSDLALKARMATEAFNSIAGMQCNPVQGAMYAFPRIELPTKLIDEAKEKGMEPDVMYCNALLEEKGVCALPGSGFGQKPGTYHFRITILPPVEKLDKVFTLIKEFHSDMIGRYKV